MLGWAIVLRGRRWYPGFFWASSLSAGLAASIAKILFLVFIVLLIVSCDLAPCADRWSSDRAKNSLPVGRDQAAEPIWRCVHFLSAACQLPHRPGSNEDYQPGRFGGARPSACRWRRPCRGR